jgi:uncharacterized protein (TIGR00661 family)
MNIVDNSKILIAVLNMGLGHVTRTIPIIKYFKDLGWNVLIASSGRALIFLQQEFPQSSFLELPDYNLEYSSKGVGYGKLMIKIPSFIKTIRQENLLVNDFVRLNKIHFIISDHRYGCFSHVIPSFFISHQLRIKVPLFLKPLEFLVNSFSQYFHNKYTAVFIPDIYEENSGLLSGKLSRSTKLNHYHYVGILSSISKKNIKKLDVDIFVSISGPEPQRSVFEQIIRSQIGSIPGKKIVTLGKPESKKIEVISDDLIIYHHFPRQEMEEMFNRCKLVIARSGYTTIMELAALGKRALLIPTPGQTEQVYLAKHLRKKGWCHSVSQKSLNLDKDIRIANSYQGIPQIGSTFETLINISKLLKIPY